MHLHGDVIKLLDKYNADERLKRHLMIVHSVTSKILDAILLKWSDIRLNKSSILTGAAIHDIGKAIVTSELYDDGDKHPEEGYRLLKKEGYPEKIALFALKHENWKDEDLPLEILLVSLADTVWTGRREDELEEKVISKIAMENGLDYWDVFVKMDEIISEAGKNPGEKIAWQDEG